MTQSPVQVLVVAHRTAATPALLDAVRERAGRDPDAPAPHFHLLVPDPEHSHVRSPGTHSEGDKALALALPLIAEAADGHASGSVSGRHDPMDAIEEELRAREYDEIILSTLPRRVSLWLHVDLPHRVAHIGLPLTTVVARDHEPAAVG